MKTLIKTIKERITEKRTFMKDIISSSTESSSKRYIMIGSFYILCVLALLNQIFGLKVESEFVYTFAGLAGGTAVMTVIENVTAKLKGTPVVSQSVAAPNPNTEGSEV